MGRRAGSPGWQGNAAADRETLHQHPPALSCHFLATDDVVQRDEDVLAADRAVQEWCTDRTMAAADFHALGVPGDQRTGDAVVFGIAEEAIRIKHAEGQSDDRRHRRQRDPAFLEIEADTQHFLAVHFLLADDTGIGQRGGIGTRARAGQAEAGNLPAIGQARQVVLLLLFGTVLDEQLARAERVWHANRDHQHFVRGQLLQYRRLRLRGKLQAAIFLRNDHAEELLFLEEVPQFFRQVGPFDRDVPGVAHGDGVGALVIHKCLFFLAQSIVAIDQQAVPVRTASKQLTVPANGAGLQGDLLGIRDLWRHLLERGEDAGGQPTLAEAWQTGGGRDRGTNEQYQGQPTGSEDPGQEPDCHHHTNGRFGPRLAAHDDQQTGQRYHKQNKSHHRSSLSSMDFENSGG